MRLSASIRIITFSGLFLCAHYANSQSCYCPPVSGCAACNGGLSNLSLVFNGSAASTVTAYELAGTSQVFSGVVNPGDTFTFSSTIPSQKFGGLAVTMLVNGILDATITTICATTVKPGDVVGSFTVAAASSLNGGPICCTTAPETIPPVITGCPINITMSTIASACSAVATWTAPTATDNCTLASFISDHNSGDSFPQGTTSVTYTATDSYNNTSTCSFNVIVNDNIAPVITGCPTDITTNASASACSAIVTWTPPAATDNCTLSSFTSDHISGDTFSLGTTPVTYTATDNKGNTSTCSFNVIVNDNTAPVITGCPTDISINASALCSTVVTWTAPAATDNCTLTSFTSNHNSGDSFPLGTTLVTYTATDNKGNTSTCSFNVVVNDNTAPVISGCLTDITTNANASCSTVVTWTAPAAIDNCTLSSFTSNHNSGDSFPLGTTLVTYTATDSKGNTSTCSFNVTVNDNTAPVITGCPADIITNASASCSTAVTWTAPAATDNCTLTSFTSNHNSGDSFPLGTTLVTYTATDSKGNTSTCSFNVIVNDNTAPVISGCPTDITTNASASACSAIVTWTSPTASDNCTLSSFTSNHNSGESFPLGITLVTYTATDGKGNTSSCSFNVIVNDNTAPVISGCPTNISINASASCSAIATWIVPTATDNCTLSSFTSDHNSGDSFPLGTTLVTYTASDSKGNTSTCSFSVTVNDASNPVITNCPSDITVTASSSCQATVSWTAPTATDNCSVAIFVTDHAAGSVFPMGTTIVTYIAADQKGNKSSCSFTVSVRNGSDPDIKGCPDNIVVNANENGTIAVTWPEPVGSVQCGNVSVKKSHEPGSTFPVGTSTVVYEFSDDYNNTSTCTFNVSVLEYEALFAVAKAITPDGDGINDVWILTNIEKYTNNSVLVVDRWGNKIYSATGYDNQNVVWNATNTSGTPVPTGTYFYKIEVQTQGRVILKTGFLEVIQ